MDEINWHQRFVQQAGWTHELRTYLFQKANLASASRLLEVGCGTGAILAELSSHRHLSIHGLDLDATRLVEAQQYALAAYTCGDALLLPYQDQSFDITCCHFLLLWVKDPLQALVEMKRVTRHGGHVLAMAEPDYSQRVDKPDSLAHLGQWQAEALRTQGATPEIGSKLGALFIQAKLMLIETGPLGGQGISPMTPEERQMEWKVLEADLGGSVPEQDLLKLKKLDLEVWQKGERILFVPTYYAWGKA